jgi:hypothetical protein
MGRTNDRGERRESIAGGAGGGGRLVKRIVALVQYDDLRVVEWVDLGGGVRGWGSSRSCFWSKWST